MHIPHIKSNTKSFYRCTSVYECREKLWVIQARLLKAVPSREASGIGAQVMRWKAGSIFTGCITEIHNQLYLSTFKKRPCNWTHNSFFFFYIVLFLSQQTLKRHTLIHENCWSMVDLLITLLLTSVPSHMPLCVINGYANKARKAIWNYCETINLGYTKSMTKASRSHWGVH